MIEINPKAKPKPVPPSAAQLNADDLWAHWMNGGRLEWAYKPSATYPNPVWHPYYDQPHQRAVVSKQTVMNHSGTFQLRKMI